MPPLRTFLIASLALFQRHLTFPWRTGFVASSLLLANLVSCLFVLRWRGWGNEKRLQWRLVWSERSQVPPRAECQEIGSRKQLKIFDACWPPTEQNGGGQVVELYQSVPRKKLRHKQQPISITGKSLTYLDGK